jgi:flavodoxin
MKTLIVCVSVSHGNTRKIASAMADVLGAEVVEPEDVDVATLGEYDLVGFGSGIFGMAFHPRLRTFVTSLPTAKRGKAFVFATSGGPELPFWQYTRPMVALLETKGLEVVGTFRCRGFDTWLPLRLVGGLNKHHPNDADLAAAAAFAADCAHRPEPERSRLMSEFVEERDEAPTIEVRVFRHGELVHRELCESEEQASLVIDEWAELDGVECEVDDLSVRHRPGEIMEPEPAEVRDEGYPDQREVDRSASREH